MENTENSAFGACLTMCPLSEIKLREREGLLHRLEIPDPTKNKKTSLNYAVKEYKRSAAGQKMRNTSDLRPPWTLMYTIKHLLETVFISKDIPQYIIYAFIADRLRSIRQDMIIQRVPRLYCVAILQPIVKFYAFSAYNLCEENISNFDPVLNQKHLNECLKMLLSLYDEIDLYNEIVPEHVAAKAQLESGIETCVIPVNFHDTRAFMESLYLILNLGHTEALWRFLTLPKNIRTKQVREAFKLSVSFRNGNWVRSCRIAFHLAPLLAAIFAIHLPVIRRNAFLVMSTAYSVKNLTYPAQKLKEILLYENIDDLYLDLEYFGISFDKNTNCVQFLKSNFLTGKTNLQLRKELFIDQKFEKVKVPTLLLYGK